jgi:sporulation-control protein spo0M
MGFSDKMRESLGAEGARIEITPPSDPLVAGERATVTIAIVGGTRPASVDALSVRIIEADRHWVDPDGATMSEADASALPDRHHLTAGWDRATASDTRVPVGVNVDAAGHHEIEVPIDIPASCKESSASCSHTLNVQADIKGQIDPTANLRITITRPE